MLHHASRRVGTHLQAAKAAAAMQAAAAAATSTSRHSACRMLLQVEVPQCEHMAGTFTSSSSLGSAGGILGIAGSSSSLHGSSSCIGGSTANPARGLNKQASHHQAYTPGRERVKRNNRFCLAHWVGRVLLGVHVAAAAAGSVTHTNTHTLCSGF